MAPIETRSTARDSGLAARAGLGRPGASRPLTSVFGWSLPGDALSEFVLRCGLGVGVETVPSGIGHVP